MKMHLKRLDDAFNFEATAEDGNKVLMDGSKAIGGNEKGIRPMQMLIAAIGGCSAIDIVMILKKQKQEITSFEMEINGEREPNKEPSLWQDIHIDFILKGNIDTDKAQRAIELSMEKYCSVSKTLEAAGAKITYALKLN